MKTFRKKIKHLLRDISSTPFVLNILGYLIYLYSKFVAKTSKFHIEGKDMFIKTTKENNGSIFITWHGRVLLLPHFLPKECPMKALVSPHQDGQIIARVLRCCNIGTIDGSTHRNAKAAALRIYKEITTGISVAIIPDGPVGPRMKLNKSVVYFAQKTGKPIIGFTYSIKDAKVIKKSWDAMLLPLPFKEGVILPTKPYFIPPELTEEELETYRQKIEDELNEITFKADELCNIEKIEIGVCKRKKYQNKTNQTN